MKKLKLLVIVLLTVISTVSAKNNKIETLEIQASINVNDNDLIYLQLDNPGKTKVNITILDSKGIVLHNESLKSDLKVLKRFDVSNLPKGVYTYRVSNETYTMTKKIEKL